MKRIVIVIFWLVSLSIYSQDNKTWIENHIDLNGYINYSNIVLFHNGKDLQSNNLWQNRLNFKGYLNDHIVLKTALRNRIFYGDWLNPFMKSSLQKKQGIFNLSTSLIDEKALLEISTIDRLNLDINIKQWEIIIGRQRINWGMNTIWNPTDIFNTANFLDFDYEEKPGTDALRIIYDINGMSGIEWAYTSNKTFDKKENIWAVRYVNSIKSNDIQLQLGNYKNTFYAGFGWAGNFGNLGMKIETGFYNASKKILISSIETSYAFRKAMLWTSSVLYNGAYENGFSQISLFTAQNLDVLHLFPSKWAFYNQIGGNLGPAWNWSLGALYGDKNHLVILIPSLEYAISDTWEMDVFMSSFFADIPGMKQTNILNFRWSYHF